MHNQHPNEFKILETKLKLNKSLPKIKLRQTYGMTEIGILDVKSKSSASLEICITKNNHDYKIIDEANWLKPEGENPSLNSLPVTQVSYNDAIKYCKWAGVNLPTYEQYWKLASTDERLIVSDNKYPISPVEEVNIIGNVWDITEAGNSDQVRLAGGSLFCSIDTCHGTQKDRELYVDKETGNIHIGFSVLSE